jgi:hypothetical protein
LLVRPQFGLAGMVRFHHGHSHSLHFSVRLCGVVLRTVLICVSTTAQAQNFDPASKEAQLAEFQIKSAFVFHFAQLVDWPPQALGDAEQPVSFCTMGQDYLPGILESTVQNKKIGSHPIRIRHLSGNESPQACQVLFILGKDRRQTAQVLTTLKNFPILTVGESDDFAVQGGMIGFCLQENKIRFEINLQAAQRANLKMSSRLLLLAKSVIGDPGQGTK